MALDLDLFNYSIGLVLNTLLYMSLLFQIPCRYQKNIHVDL